MPGTTRYSATFDRPYEEEDRPEPPPPPLNGRHSRSRSLGWQVASPGLTGGGAPAVRPPAQRSSSTDSSSSPGKPTENIPTRTVVKTVVKPHSNPFQFVKVGTCPLYKKAEEQLKKVKEVKKPDVLKEEEEEWQSNLDSWKSRRRKMSEDVFRRQEEIKQIELEEQVAQLSQKKTKTFSEMLESRAHRGRALSLSLISSPLDLQNWEVENNSHKNDSCSTFSGESEENSTANSEDEGVSLKGMLDKSSNSCLNSHRTNGNSHTENSNSDSHNGNYSKLSDISSNGLQIKPKEGSYIDSGLESISSHRAGDTPDSGSDFSHDSGSSIDCESPRTGVNVLEEFSSKSSQLSSGKEISVRLCMGQKGQEFGFTFSGGKDEGRVFISSIVKGSKADLSSVCLGDQIVAINGIELDSRTHSEIASLIQKATEKGEINLQLWKTSKNATSNAMNGAILNDHLSSSENISSDLKSPKMIDSYEKSIESENEMFVDDFEELERQSELAAASNQSNEHDSNSSPFLREVNALSSSGPGVLNSTFVVSKEASLMTEHSTIDSVSDVNSTSKARRKGVHSLEIQNSKEKLSFPSFLPLSPVTELPTPEDAKTIASTLLPQKSLVPEAKVVHKQSSINGLALNSSDFKKNTSSPKASLSHPENKDNFNIVFQTQPKTVSSERSQSSNVESGLSNRATDVLPVEKVAEEMERLILQQLEEEERAKEQGSGVLSKVPFGSPEHLLTAPPKLAEPPKEKPPPPPPATEDSPPDSSLKRLNSTKRIKKEIYKRRSNFLGIEDDGDSLIANEALIPPPPALEEILKAEMELDRQTRLQIESAATERLTLEEKELMQKEREIIETLESEERQKQLISSVDDLYDVEHSSENDALVEEQIEFLKNEQKRMELEKISEEQQLRLLEENQLRELQEREEIIRKQEAGQSPLSEPFPHSVASPAPNSLLTSLSVDSKDEGSSSAALGGGLTSNSALDCLKGKPLDSAGTPKPVQKPAVPPKPLKKKEAIRKERERLRQEQEALQREREVHRQKLLQEQELQKSHAPDVPASRLGPLPPLVQPSFHPPLTATPFTRDTASFPSRSHHGASNIPVGTMNSGELMGPVVAKQGPMPPVRKPLHTEGTWGQQKVTSVRKQNPDSFPESRYNQNHWLIQEAEMRRIADLKDRQRRQQLSRSQTNLAEDDVCSSNPSRLPAVSPSHNFPLHDKAWSYNQLSALPLKQYPPPVAKEPLHIIYPPVPQKPPPKPSRVMPIERQEQMLSVSGRKRCSHCSEELGRGAAMIIESLQLYYHIHCFRCCVCLAQLGNGSCGTDVRVRNQKLHCHNCYSNDEAGLKFSQV